MLRLLAFARGVAIGEHEHAFIALDPADALGQQEAIHKRFGFLLVHQEIIPILVLESSSEKKTEVKDFLLRLVNTYIEHQEAIDNSIKEASTKWEIGRMVNIDLDILRLACAETFFMPDIPIAVAINEAVELCHRFADEKAAKFVNGILADLSEEAIKLREEDVARKQSKI